MSETIVPVNVYDQYVKDYKLYALYVCRHRVSVDSRDGLKPVHRKIIYSAFDKGGRTKYPNVVKSASIVGDVMAQYHPHGDCIHGDTVIYSVDGGMYRIKDLYNNKIESRYILAVDPITLEIVSAPAHSFRIGQYADKIYHIKFSNGFELRCTGNHPIMMINGSWMKAQDITAGMIPMRKPVRIFGNRPSIDDNYIQNIVFNSIYGPLPAGCIRHHKDGNTFNNHPLNLEAKSRAEHALHHKDYGVGLANGRKLMFELDGPIKRRVKEKNSKLMSLFNQEQGIRRFKKAIEILRDRGLDISEENYESLRGEIYNLPMINRLVDKGYGSNFIDLVNIELSSIADLYSGNSVEKVRLIKPLKKCRKNKIAEMKLKDVFDDLIIRYGFIDYSIYCNNVTTTLDYESFNHYYQIYLHEYPIITSIEIEELNEPIPMYDFTIDGYGNMIIPMGSLDTGCMPMLCIHNSAIYGAMKPMSNDFEIYVPLLNGSGAWGDKCGAPAAASRYTESGLTKFTQEYLLGDLYETPNCVDWLPNFDGNTTEPDCLPAALPLALIEGSFGIAVGFKVEIPKHNISEVIDATIKLIKNPNAHITLIPDHCQPCEIIDTDFDTISNIGLGKYTVRGIIEDTTHFDGRPALLCKTAPDLIYFNTIKEKIEDLIISKKLINIEDILSPDDHLLIVLKRGTDANYVKQLIYQNTDMQKSCRVNFEVLDGLTPIRMSYKGYILQWIEFRKFTKFRVFCNKAQDINTRLHTIEPYVKMAKTDDLDMIIDMIRSKSLPDNELMEFLIKKLNITDLQAKFIMNIKLKELSRSYFKKFEVEYNELCKNRDVYMNLLTDQNALDNVIVEELQEAKRKYGCPRKCKVISRGDADGIPSGEFKLIFTKNNYVKKIPLNENVPSFRNDEAKFIIKGENAENVIIFTETGKAFKLPLHKIPFSDKRSNGIDVRLLLKNCTSNINAVIYEPSIVAFTKKLRKHYLVALTKHGYIKKMDLDDFLAVNTSGLIYSKLDSDDYIIDMMIVTDQADVVVYSTNKAVRFPMTAVPYLKRATKGNKTMSSDVDGLSMIVSETTDIVVTTRKGYVNKFSPLALASNDRTSRPSKVIKLTKDDEILSVLGLRHNDILVITSSSGKTNIPVKDIPIGSSVGGGTKMLTHKGDTIVSCSFMSE